MTATAPTEMELALAMVPPVAPTPGLLAVWELVEGYHELYHRDRWLRLVKAQRSRVAPANGQAPTVYLTLEGILEQRTTRTIDRSTGEIDVVSFTVHLGPVLVRTAATLVRARTPEK